jgi:hypothetical protein
MLDALAPSVDTDGVDVETLVRWVELDSEVRRALGTRPRQDALQDAHVYGDAGLEEAHLRVMENAKHALVGKILKRALWDRGRRIVPDPRRSWPVANLSVHRSGELGAVENFQRVIHSG